MSRREPQSPPAEIASAALSGRHILVVDDEPGLRAAIAAALGEHAARVATCARGDEALRRVSDPTSPRWDAIVCDLRLPGADGREVLRAARARDSQVVVVMMTAYGGVDAAVECMREGAADFLQKPFDLLELELRLARALEQRSLVDEVISLRARRGTALGPELVIAESPAMREALELARRVAAARSTVLITGETGTGKEVIAGVIHASSARGAGPFVKVNCAALPETLLESELFGHERGAFTGAERQRRGRFEEASGGTLFLDEIAEISPATQAKLLRVLQDQEFHRLGGTHSLRTDARIVAATNRDLQQLIREGAFREDLYFRLDVIGLHLPPLRERPEDAVALAERFLEHFCRELAGPARGFTQAAMDRIRAYAWPGNVRELRNAVERAVLTGERERIDAADLVLADRNLSDLRDLRGLGGVRLEWPPEGISLRALERAAIDAALRRSGYVQKDAAELLGISRRKLNYKIQQLGITHGSWRRNRAG